MRVIGETPLAVIKRSHQTGLRRLGFFAVIGGIGLSGDDKNFADRDVLDCAFRSDAIFVTHAHFQPIPTARRGVQFGAKIDCARFDGRQLPPVRCRACANEPRFQRGPNVGGVEQ